MSDHPKPKSSRLENIRSNWGIKKEKAPETTSSHSWKNITDLNALAAKSIESMLSGNMEEYNQITKHINYLRSQKPESNEIVIHKQEGSFEYDSGNLAAPKEHPSSSSRSDPYRPLSKAEKKEKALQKEKQEEEKSIQDIRREILQGKKDSLHGKNAHTKCPLCPNSHAFAKNYCEENEFKVISITTKVALLAKNFKDTHMQGNILIVPLTHYPSLLNADEETLDEIRNFQKCLIEMFNDLDDSFPVFVEHVKRLPISEEAAFIGGGSHSFIEVFVVPNDKFDDCKIMLRHALEEFVSDWSQNRKILNIPKGRDSLRQAIPKNFPYFHADYSLQGGIVHVLDEEEKMPSTFAYEVIMTVLDLTKLDRAYRTPEEYHSSTISWKKKFARYDWTK